MVHTLWLLSPPHGVSVPVQVPVSHVQPSPSQAVCDVCAAHGVIVPVHVDVPLDQKHPFVQVAELVNVLHGDGMPEQVPPRPESFAVQVQPSAWHWAW